MRRAVMMGAVFMVAGVLLGGCSEHADEDSLYPIAVGLSWKYRVQTERKNGSKTKAIRVMKNVAREYFAGEDDVLVRRNELGTRYYVARRDDGFYRIAVKSPVSHTPIMEQSPVKILPLPAAKDSQWSEPAHTFMLQRAQNFIEKKAPGNRIKLKYRIVKTDAAIRVPAGRFNDCVLAEGKISFHLGVEAGFAASDVPIVQREWYCPGVGLTRLSRNEKLISGEQTITGGHMEIELLNGP